MAFTKYDVYNALGLTAENGTQTLINSIRNSTDFKNMTEIFDGTVEGLKDFGVAVNHTTKTQNMFIDALVDRIGKVVITKVSLENPLKRFKKGRMDTGKSVEEIFSDLIKAKSFNPDDAAETLFRRTTPNTKVIFHNNWRKEFYEDTIERTTIQEAFTSLDKFDEFITTIYGALYNSNEVDEYLWTKALIESYVGNGFAKYIEVPEVVDETTAKLFVKKARATATRMTLPQGSRDFNAMGVHTRTDKSRLWVMIDADLDAELDVDVLARAFNMNKTDLQNNKIVVENFAVNGLQAVLFDEEIFKIFDKEFLLNSVENEKGLYFKIFLHVHQLYSMSKLNNLVAFMSSDIPAVKRLIVTPFTKYIKLNQEEIFSGYAEVEGKLSDYDVKVEVLDSAGATKTGVTASIKNITDAHFDVSVKATNVKVVDEDLTVRVTVSTKASEDSEVFSRYTDVLIVTLPDTEK